MFEGGDKFLATIYMSNHHGKPSLKEMFYEFCDPKLPDKRAGCKQYDKV